MATLTQSTLNSPRNVVVATLSNPLAADFGDTDAKRQLLSRTLRITQALQTSLDLSQLIETFAVEVKGCIPIEGLRYVNDLAGVDAKVGRNAANACAFRLTLNEQPLGEVTFCRKAKFSGAEQNDLETLLRSLVHPLRNALMYRTALVKSQRDPLTNAYNRAALSETLKREVELAHRHKTTVSLIVIDIDHFKTINDTYGHAAGDCLLNGLVECATGSIRRCDMLFRYGGEEFVVLLNNTDAKGAARLAERIRRNVEREEFVCAGKVITMTVSAGVASLRPKDLDATLFARADQALYRAKTAGRNCVRSDE
jgi:diguanylate cyclase (GGDEF)-like protein